MTISFLSIKIVAIVLLVVLPLILLIIRRVRHGGIMIPHSNIIFASALLPIAYGLSAFFAADKGVALLGFDFNTDSTVVILLGFLALVLTALASIRKGTEEKIRKGVAYLITTIIVIFLAQIAVQLFDIKSLSFINYIQLVNSWLDVAVLAGLSTVFLLTGISSDDDKSKKTIAIKVASAIVLIAILGIFANVLSVFILLALVALLKLVQALRLANNSKMSMAIVIPAIILASSLFFIADNTLMSAKVSNTLQGLVSVSFVDVRPNWQGTLDVAKGTVTNSDITAKLFGPGAGTFDSQWRMFKPAGVNTTQFWGTNFKSAIGFIPTSIITGGAVVFAAWLIFLLAILAAAIKSRGSVLSLATMFIWVFAILNPVDTLVLIIAFILTGLFVAESSRARLVRVINHKLSGDTKNKLLLFVIIPVVVIAGIFSVTIVTHRIVVNTYITKASNMMIAGQMNDAEQLLNKAKGFTNTALVERGYTRVAMAKLSTLLQESEKDKSKIDQATLQAALANVLAHAQRAIEREPNNPINYVILGNISEQLISLKIEGASESAIAAYTRAAALDPKNPSIPLAISRVYNATGNIKELAIALESALALKPNYQPALYQYGLLKLSEKDTKTAIQALGAILQVNQSNANAMYYLSLALAQESRIDEALMVMQRVAVLNPDNEDVKKIITAYKQQLATNNAQKQSNTQAQNTNSTTTLEKSK